MFSSNTTQVSDGGYQISRSLRFNKADSAYLNRTPANASNRKTWTYSAWLKRSGLASYPNIFNANDNEMYFRFNDDETLNFGGTGYSFQTTQVFRDPAAWYHFIVAVDTTQATSTNRVKLYVNNTQITVFNTSTYPTQNLDTAVNNTNVHRIGVAATYDAASYLSGYMTEVNFIDGTQLTPSSFGETNAQTGVWQPKAYAGSYGTNGFYLNFSDNSNTTAATLGKDYSGNGNNWTPNNFSVTAGAGNDSLVDSPTSYGVDTGVGGTVRGNYCTLNPLNAGSTATLSDGNLNITGTIAATTSLAYSTIGVSSGKWYWEVTPLTGDHMIGIGKDGGRFDWQTTNGYSYFGNNGQKYTNSAGSAYGATYANNDVIGVGLDMDAGTLTFYKNGTSQGTAFSGLTGTWFPIAQNPGSPLTEAFNFGQRPFAYTAPSGFKALCTQNLPTPTIGATTATQAGKFFNPVLWTGNDTSGRSLTGVGFQPDFVWIKQRSGLPNWNILNDVVRGVPKNIYTNATDAEDTTSYVTALNSDGFTVSNSGAVNGSTYTYVAWNWKANGSGSTNTAGSITSTVSANTTSGFSVVTYSGTLANATVGHGLGIAPSMLIFKRRDGTTNWNVYHSSIGASNNILLNTTGAMFNDTAFINNTAPTSTVFSVGNAAGTNQGSMLCYVFAEVAGYSKAFSYTANGSTDGPFIYLGFRPAYLLIKGATVTGAWWLIDCKRSTYNLVDKLLFANLSNAEDTYGSVDLLSNGFKIRNNNSDDNTGTYTYIGMAFAEFPFKYSLAR